MTFAPQWPGHLRRWAAPNCRHGTQDREEVGNAGRLHVLIGGVWEGGRVVLTSRRHTGQECVSQIDRAPSSDAVNRIAGNIRRIERTEWGLKLKPAAKLQRIGLFRRLMAGIATTDKEYAPPPSRVARLFAGLPFRNCESRLGC